jgi:hypothetical protein
VSGGGAAALEFDAAFAAGAEAQVEMAAAAAAAFGAVLLVMCVFSPTDARTQGPSLLFGELARRLLADAVPGGVAAAAARRGGGRAGPGAGSKGRMLDGDDGGLGAAETPDLPSDRLVY